jgi:hypothetical protein
MRFTVTVMVFVMIFFVRIDRGANRATEGAADNRAIAAGDLVADCRAGSSPDTPADRRIHSGVVRRCIHGQQAKQ